MKKIFVLTAVFSIIFCCANAQDYSAYEKKWVVQNGDTLPYRMLKPFNYDSSKTYPVIFFLHGAGERGNDNQRQLIHGGKLFASDSVRGKYPAFVVIPQCSTNDYWSNTLRTHDDKKMRSFDFIANGPAGRTMEMLQELVTQILEQYPVNKQQVYVGGLSMGGMGTFELVRRMPNTFAAAFPICGGANPLTAKQMKKTQWWIFHGAKDDVVPPHHSQNMYDALKNAKAKVKFTLYPNANHNSWDSAFKEPGLLDWLFGVRKR